MPKLLFFSRVALICNVCFLLTYLLNLIPVLSNGIITSTIIMLGIVLSIVLNTMLNILYIIMTLAGKRLTDSVPKWLVIVNFLFFVFQVIFLLK
jgi:hypothetical protein